MCFDLFLCIYKLFTYIVVALFEGVAKVDENPLTALS
jgi:hypothetical protein